MTVCVIMNVGLIWSIIGAAPLQASTYWRNAQNGDGICLLFFLQIHGLEPDEKRVLSECAAPSRRLSYDEFIRVGKMHGLTLSIGKIDVSRDGIDNSQLPVIASMRESITGARFFTVILAVNDLEFVYFNSNTATIESLEKSEFLRAWDGLVIYAESNGQWMRYVVSFFCGGMLCVFVFQLVRLWRLRVASGDVFTQ